MNDAGWVEIFSSPNPAQIAAMRAALSSENVAFTVRGELTMAMRGCVTPARILVRASDQGRAAALLKRMTATMSC